MAFALAQRIDQMPYVGRILVVLATVAVLAIVMSLVFGVNLGTMDYRIAPDPAGNLPF